MIMVKYNIFINKAKKMKSTEELIKILLSHYGEEAILIDKILEMMEDSEARGILIDIMDNEGILGELEEDDDSYTNYSDEDDY